MTDNISNIGWLIPLLVSLLASGLAGMVALFMGGMRKDLRDIAAKVDKLAREGAPQADVRQMQDQLTLVRVEIAKMQEQLYSILRGDPRAHDPKGT